MADIANLNDLQSLQAVDYGEQAARYSDPFMAERGQYQNQLSKLMKNPGSFFSSPFYKAAYDQGLNALQRKGSVRSGNKLAALMKYGKDIASQSFFPMVDRLSQLAQGGSSPAAAGLSYAAGTNRGQDYASMAAAARNSGGGGNAMNSQFSGGQPWWMQGAGADYDRMLNGNTGQVGPRGETSGYNSGYSPGGTFGDPRGMSLAQLNAEGSLYGLPSVNPYAGPSGGAFSGGPGYGGFQNYMPSGGGGVDNAAYAEQDYWGYE